MNNRRAHNCPSRYWTEEYIACNRLIKKVVKLLEIPYYFTSLKDKTQNVSLNRTEMEEEKRLALPLPFSFTSKD
jgi:hypothetical protein